MFETHLFGVLCNDNLMSSTKKKNLTADNLEVESFTSLGCFMLMCPSSPLPGNARPNFLALEIYAAPAAVV